MRLDRLMRRLEGYFPRSAAAVRNLKPGVRGRRRRLAGKGNTAVFAEIFEQNGWQCTESRSGHGSTLTATESLRRALPGVLRELEVRTLLDAPCGDFQWMKEVDLGVDEYIGADIVPELVEELQARYGDARRTFRVLDLVTDPLPAADAWLCRDCFLHLSNAQVARALENFRTSRCELLLTTIYPEMRGNADIATGLFRPINLCASPFNLPAPRLIIEDGELEGFRRSIGVWDRSQLARP